MPIQLRNDITSDYLKSLVEYDPQTGLFRRLTAGSKQPSLKPNSGGYLRVRIDAVSYKAHRLAWLYHYGEWPKGEIDHINGNRADNRIENLRDVTHVENQRNMKSHRGEPSLKGYGSVQRTSCKTGWVARLGNKYLGYFRAKETAESAIAAYLSGSSPVKDPARRREGTVYQCRASWIAMHKGIYLGSFGSKETAEHALALHLRDLGIITKEPPNVP